MFHFHPLEKKHADKLFVEQGLTPTKDTMAIVATNCDHDEQVGFCLFQQEKLTVTILALQYQDEDPFLSEVLIKTALNFAANRGAYLAECTDFSMEKELRALSFEEENHVLTATIPSVMRGCCGKEYFPQGLNLTK